MPPTPTPWLPIPPSGPYLLHNAFVPDACVADATGPGSPRRLRRTQSTLPDVDSLLHVDIAVGADGVITSVEPARPRGGRAGVADGVALVDARCGIVLPAFCDLHTHIGERERDERTGRGWGIGVDEGGRRARAFFGRATGRTAPAPSPPPLSSPLLPDKSHTCERSRNAHGSLSGADRSTARDAALWSAPDVERRMEFSVATAYAHGTAALRTHLINMTPRQVELTWPAFDAVRARWRGKVRGGVFFREGEREASSLFLVADTPTHPPPTPLFSLHQVDLQAVSLVVLSFFRDEAAAAALADTVASHCGVLGAAVCCAENGGDPDDEWTTCPGDRDELLDR